MSTDKQRCSTRIYFSSHSFLTGMGSAFNIAGNYYKCKDMEDYAVGDLHSIHNDWCIVGGHINEAIEEAEKNSKQLELEFA